MAQNEYKLVNYSTPHVWLYIKTSAGWQCIATEFAMNFKLAIFRLPGWHHKIYGSTVDYAVQLGD